jgi:flagellar M-ring protein FliF
MNQSIRIWNSLSKTQRISLVVAPLLVCAIAFSLVRWMHESDFRTLYTSLAPEDASAVTQKIREAGIEYRLDETGATIQVPSARLAEARLALAGAGLPRSGRIGFELFDKANLGASDFTEQVNYRRALEGELERTVATLSEVSQARIHLTFAKESVFLDSRQPAKATVVLQLKRISHLQQANVTAIANLVASAVDGLAPESVAIIDGNGRLLNRPRTAEDGEAKAAEGNLDYRRQLESEMLAKINAAIEPLLGAGRFRAGINIDCDFTSTEQNDETFDPAKSVMLTSQKTEESTSSAATGGTPGTASNLPQPPARASVGSSGIMRRTENVSYQPSRTVRRTVSPRGALRRVSTAVLLDQTVRWDGIGAKARRTIIPPSPEVIKGVRDVIAGITGYSEQRGDQITVETLPFESTLAAEPPSVQQLSPQHRTLDSKQPLILGGGALLVLLIGAIAFLLMRRPAVSAPAVHGIRLPVRWQLPGPPRLSRRARPPKPGFSSSWPIIRRSRLCSRCKRWRASNFPRTPRKRRCSSATSGNRCRKIPWPPPTPSGRGSPIWGRTHDRERRQGT